MKSSPDKMKEYATILNNKKNPIGPELPVIGMQKSQSKDNALSIKPDLGQKFKNSPPCRLMRIKPKNKEMNRAKNNFK